MLYNAENIALQILHTFLLRAEICTTFEPKVLDSLSCCSDGFRSFCLD